MFVAEHRQVQAKLLRLDYLCYHELRKQNLDVQLL